MKHFFFSLGLHLSSQEVGPRSVQGFAEASCNPPISVVLALETAAAIPALQDVATFNYETNHFKSHKNFSCNFKTHNIPHP